MKQTQKKLTRYLKILSLIAFAFFASCSSDDDDPSPQPIDKAFRLKKITLGSRAQELFYDSNNKLIKTITKAPDGSITTDNYVYNALGQLIEAPDLITLTYNANGKIAKITNNLYNTQWTFTYNAQNLLESVASIGGTYNSINTYIYNANNRIIENRTTLIGHPSIERYTYTYNNEGDIINQKYYYSDDGVIDELKKEYNLTYSNKTNFMSPILKTLGGQDNNVYVALNFIGGFYTSAFIINSGLYHYIYNDKLFNSFESITYDPNGVTRAYDYEYIETDNKITQLLFSSIGVSTSTYNYEYEEYTP